MNRSRRSWLSRALPVAAATGALVAGLVSAPAANAAGFVSDPASYVNTLAGTGSGGAVVGSINNFPGPAVPFGMMQFSPSNGDNGTGYRWGNTNLQGFAVNMASQGCTAYGNFPLLPTTIDPTTGTPWSRTSKIVTNSQVAQVGYYKVDTTDADNRTIGAELAATDRSGIAKFTFPSGQTPSLIVRSGRLNGRDAIKSSLNVNPNNQTITGWAASQGFCSATPHAQYRIFYTAKFDKPFTAYGAWNEDTGTITNKTVGTGNTDAEFAAIKKAGGYVRFAPGTTDVAVKISISYVKTGDLALGQANPSSNEHGGSSLNLATEIPTSDYAASGTTPYASYSAAFDAIRQDTYDRWNALLGKVKISDTASERDIKTFYHALYRSFLHPNLFSDVNGQYAGFDKFNFVAAGGTGTEILPTIHTIAEANALYGTNMKAVYANYSDWDTYRSWAPLAAMIAPEEMSDITQTYVLQADQAGQLPRWSLANASTGQMSGDNASAQIAQSYAFGAKNFAVSKALHWMYDGAFGANAGVNTGGQNAYSITRPGAKEYNELGFAPQSVAFQTDHAVTGASIAQEWSIDDFAVSEFAEAIGSNNWPSSVPANVDAVFRERTNNWQAHINPLTSCLSPRDSSGRFPVGTNCNSTPGDFGYRGNVTGYGQIGFDEALSEQYLWMAPQNLKGLAAVLGGRDATAERLDTFMTGGYNVGANVPKMWAGNEPNFATPWAYNYLGRPWRTQEVVDDIRNQLFGYNPDGAEPGNDDLGAMSAWYVWAALGVYPATPGNTVLTVNTPNFEHAVVELGNGKTLTINAPGATSKRYISGLAVNGTAQTSTAVDHGWIDQNTTLNFTLANSPTTWGTAEADAPPSFEYGSQSLLAYGDGITVRPGQSADAAIAVQRITSKSQKFAFDTTGLPAGFTVESSTGSFDSRGHGTQTVSVYAGAGVADGDYKIPLKVVTPEGDSYTSHLMVRVARAGGFLDATSLQAVSSAKAGDVDFDGTNRGYIRDLLTEKGLAPGVAADLGVVSGSSSLAGLKATLPKGSEGAPDTIVPNGQTITIQGNPSKLSLIGSAKAANTAGTATVTLDDNSTASIDASFGDWVKPSSTGTASNGTLTPYSTNIKVTWLNNRFGQNSDPGSYVYATAPYTAPTGRTIKSVTLSGSTNDNRRILAIAQNTDVPAATLPAQSIGSGSATAGGTITVTGSGFAAGESVSVVLDDSTIATGTANGSGAVSITATIPVLTPGGTHSVRLEGTTSGGATASAVTITAATWSPSISAPASLKVGSQVVVTGTGFAPSEAVTVTLGSATAPAIASATGALTASIAGPSTAGTLTLSATGTLSGATATRQIEFTPLGGGPVDPAAPEVSLSASPARLTYGESTTVTAQVTAGTPGQVEFFNGTKSLGRVAIASDKAALKIGNLVSGSHGVSAQLVGTSAKSNTVFVTVIRASSGKVSVSAKKYKRKAAATVTVKVGKLSNGQYPAGRVTVYVGKKAAKKVTLKASAKGKIKVKIAKKFTKKKSIKVRAVFVPSDAKNIIGGQSALKKVTSKK